MTHLNNMPDETIRFPKWFWTAVAAVALWALVMVALACNGCRASAVTVPTTQQAIAPARSAEAHVQNAEKSAEATVPYVAAEGKPHIESTLTEIRAALPDLKTTIEQTTAANAEMRRMADELQSEKDGRTSDKKALEAKALKAKLDGDERWQKEHDAYEWIGWHTKAIIAYLLGTIAGLILLTVGLGIAGTVFPAVWPILSVAYSALKRVIGLVTLGAGRIAPLLQKFDDWFDAQVERWRAGKSVPTEGTK